MSKSSSKRVTSKSKKINSTKNSNKKRFKYYHRLMLDNRKLSAHFFSEICA